MVDTNWNMVYEDGDMKVYRRELEEGGVVVDPLKSYHVASVSHNPCVYMYIQWNLSNLDTTGP